MWNHNWNGKGRTQAVNIGVTQGRNGGEYKGNQNKVVCTLCVRGILNSLTSLKTAQIRMLNVWFYHKFGKKSISDWDYYGEPNRISSSEKFDAIC